MGRLVTSAMLKFCPECDIALMSGGGIRDSFFVNTLPGGNITFGDVFSVLPFQNVASVFHIQGRYLIEALIHMVKLGQGDGGFIQPANLRFIFNSNTSIPAENRILRIEIINKGTGAWNPIQSASFYRIVANDFLRFGGDGYSVFIEHAVSYLDYGPTLDEMFKNYLYMKVLTEDNVVTQDELKPCLQAQDFVGAASHCRILMSSGIADLRACPDGKCEIFDPVMKICGFVATSVGKSDTGKSVSLSIVIALFLVAVLVVGISVKKWMNEPVPEKLTTPQQLGLKDKFKLIIMILSSFQVCALIVTSDFTFFNVDAPWTQGLKSAFAASLADIFSVTSPVIYWSLFWTCVSFSCIFSIYILILFFHLDSLLPTSLINALSTIGPFVGTIAFIPILSTLLSVFSCMEQSSGRAFLARECNTWCWEASHITMIVISGISMCLYLPLALWARPVWEHIREDVIIKSSPIYVVLFTAINLILVVNRTFLVESPHVASTVYFVFTSAMAFYSMKYRPYNINKVNLYCVASWMIPAVTGLFNLLDMLIFHEDKNNPEDDPRSSAVWRLSAMKTGTSNSELSTTRNNYASETLLIVLLVFWGLIFVGVVIVDWIYFRGVFFQDTSSRNKTRTIAEILRKRRRSLTELLNVKIKPTNANDTEGHLKKFAEAELHIQTSNSDWMPLANQGQQLISLLLKIGEDVSPEKSEDEVHELLSNSVSFFEELQKRCAMELIRCKEKRQSVAWKNEHNSPVNEMKEVERRETEMVEPNVEKEGEYSVARNDNWRRNENQPTSAIDCVDVACIGFQLHRVWHMLTSLRNGSGLLIGIGNFTIANTENVNKESANPKSGMQNKVENGGEDNIGNMIKPPVEDDYGRHRDTEKENERKQDALHQE